MWLWPALLDKRNPTLDEVLTKDSEMGVVVRGFASMACATFSTGLRHELPKNNSWQLERIRELTSSFRDIAVAFVNFAVSKERTMVENCEAFLRSVETQLAAAAAKVEQLDADLAYKNHGPRAAKLYRSAVSLQANDFPSNLHAAVKSISKLQGGGMRPREDDDEDRQRWSRGRGGGGGRGGRGGGRGPGSPGWVVHVPGVCSKCSKSFSGLYKDHKCT